MTPRPSVAGIEVVSGAASDGRGFCTVNVTLTNGVGYQGQLDPDTVRTMALDWLGAAEAAETDAALLVWGETDLELDPPRIGAMLLGFRRAREEQRRRRLEVEARRGGLRS